MSRDILRSYAKEPNSPLTKFLQRGALVPDETLSSVIQNTIQPIMKTNKSFILDGYPRTIAQAEYLASICPLKFIAVRISLRHDIIISKLLGRRICTNCKGNFNVAHIQEDTYDMPAILPDAKKCSQGAEKCRPELVQRDDDTEEVIARRIEYYEKNITSLVDYYKSCNRFVDFDVKKGVKDVDLLFDLMMTSVSQH